MAQQQIDESEEHEQNLPRDGGPMVRTLVEATIRSLCALQAKSHRCRSPQRPSWPTAATTDENGDVSGQARAFLVRTSPSQRLTRGPSGTTNCSLRARLSASLSRLVPPGTSPDEVEGGVGDDGHLGDLAARSRHLLPGDIGEHKVEHEQVGIGPHRDSSSPRWPVSATSTE